MEIEVKAKPKKVKAIPVYNEVSDEIKLGRYQKMLDYLVENENYEKAAEIKKLMDEIKSEKK